MQVFIKVPITETQPPNLFYIRKHANKLGTIAVAIVAVVVGFAVVAIVVVVVRVVVVVAVVDVDGVVDVDSFVGGVVCVVVDVVSKE